MAAFIGVGSCAGLGIAAVLPWIDVLGETAKGVDVPVGILLNKPDPTFGLGWIALALAAVGLVASLAAPKARSIARVLTVAGGIAFALVGAFVGRFMASLEGLSITDVLGIGTYLAGACAIAMVVCGKGLSR